MRQPSKAWIRPLADRLHVHESSAPMNDTSTLLTRRHFLRHAGIATAGLLTAPRLFAAEVSPTDREKIEAALPSRAPAAPRRRRKLLIYDGNVNYGGHASIPTANTAFARMGEKTGAFETVLGRDASVFAPASLRGFDAVFFNNTVGNLFSDPALRESLAEFVHAGGGLMGVHGTSVAFTQWPGAVEDWPEFGRMLGARGANHRDSTEPVWIKLDDAAHPVNAAFGGRGFEYRDEFFRFQEVYSRDRVRVLLSIDTDKTSFAGQPRGNCIRADNDYALAWVRSYGRGRVFYSTIAHNPYVFWDARMLQFYLAATQFALGDLAAPTLPSGRLTPALRAQEALGWRLGIEAYTFHKFTLFEAIEKTAQLGLPYLGGLSFQKVSADIPKDFDDRLSDAELKQIRLKLDAAGVRLLTYYYPQIPGDDAACRRLFEFGRKIGIETFMSEPAPEALDAIEKHCDAYDIRVALHNHDPKASPVYWNPENIARLCRGRSPRLGACGDVGYWLRAGIDPLAAARTLGDRLLTIQMHDLHATTGEGHDVPWGTGAGKAEAFIREVHRLGLRPVMWGVEYSYDWMESMPKIAQSIAFFNRISMDLAK